MRHLIFGLIFVLFPVVGIADTIHVPGDQPTIQAGIDAAVDGDTVLVADGTYTGEGNHDIDFLGKAITVRSENGAVSCIIDCEEQGRGFIFLIGEGKTLVLDGFTIQNGRDVVLNGGGGIYCSDSSPTITNCTFSDNRAYSGGGICCFGGSPTITNCTFRNNIGDTMGDGGGGIHCVGSSPTISNCTFRDNSAYQSIGGGITCGNSSPMITNCTFRENEAHEGGGFICFENSSPTITNCTFIGNVASDIYGGFGGGISCSSSPSTTITITNCTFIHNRALGVWGGLGGGISCYGSSASTSITNCTFSGNQATVFGGGICSWSSSSFAPMITNCIVWENAPDGIYDELGYSNVTYSDIQGGWPGEGNIDTDPLFVTGPDGDYYLSQVAAGQTSDSPCVDKGDSRSELIQGTTRTDLVQDWGVVNMGYHYPREIQPFIAAGAGPTHDNPALVRTYPAVPSNDPLFEFNAYEAPFGVNVTCGDMNIDAMDEILTGPGPGPVAGPHVRGFQPDGTPLPGLSFLAYGTNNYGVNVAAGDIDGDGFDEIITGPGPGAVFGPHVRGWNYGKTREVTPIPGVNYFAYGTPKWGVNVSAGDLDGDGFDEIVTGPGPGAVYGPHVRGWNVDEGTATTMPGCSFYAYGTHKYGVNVSAGDIDGDGIDEIVTGPGPGAVFGAHIRGWNVDGGTATDIPNFSFFAWSPDDLRYGANVFAGADLNGNGRDEIVVGQGPDPDAGTWVKVYMYEGLQEIEWFSFEAFGDMGLAEGANVAAGKF